MHAVDIFFFFFPVWLLMYHDIDLGLWLISSSLGIVSIPPSSHYYTLLTYVYIFLMLYIAAMPISVLVFVPRNLTCNGFLDIQKSNLH